MVQAGHRQGRPREAGDALCMFFFMGRVMRCYTSIHDIATHFASLAACMIHLRHAIWACAQALLDAKVIEWPTLQQQVALHNSLPAIISIRLGPLQLLIAP
jgi:hypothetical protein